MAFSSSNQSSSGAAATNATDDGGTAGSFSSDAGSGAMNPVVRVALGTPVGTRAPRVLLTNGAGEALSAAQPLVVVGWPERLAVGPSWGLC